VLNRLTISVSPLAENDPDTLEDFEVDYALYEETIWPGTVLIDCQMRSITVRSIVNEIDHYEINCQ